MSRTPKEIRYNPIGIIHSPYKDMKGTPLQPTGSKGIQGTIKIKNKYAGGLKDIEGFSHIILIYHFHLSKGYSLEVMPFLDDTPRGVFSTRTPKRPNPIGISVVKLLRVEGSTVHVEGIDIVNGTPLLDIKPYVPAFDVRKIESIGWLSKKADKASKMKADERFG